MKQIVYPRQIGKTLRIEHDRLEDFVKTYSGKLSLNYEIDRLRQLKVMLAGRV